MKIKLKNIVLVYKLNNSISIRYNSEIINIMDEKGDISFLFSLLNGQYSELEIVNLFYKKYPDLSQDLIVDYLNTLKELNVVEYVYPNKFEEYYSKRWSRNFDFFSSVSTTFGENKYEYQDQIFNSKICLLGCGGLGSHILYELAAVGFLNITIVDFDKIELSNLNRQILYKESDLGQNKVLTACENIKKFSSKININPIEMRISSEDDIINIITGHDLVICVADKPRDKIIDWLNKACIATNIPYINGGLDLSKASFYSVIPFISGCADCWRHSISDTLQEDILNIDINDSIDYMTPAPALSPLVSVAAGIMVMEAIKIVTSISQPSLLNKLNIFDFSSFQIYVAEQWNKVQTCKTCGCGKYHV